MSTATAQPTPWAPDQEIAETIRLIAHERELTITELGETAPGLTRSKLYRRLDKPYELSIGELRAISHVVSVPVGIITAGRIVALQWMRENGETPPDGGEPSGGEPSDMLRPRQDSNLRPSAYTLELVA